MGMKNRTNIIVHGILIFLVIVWLLPVYSSLIAAFKSVEEFADTLFYSIPKTFAFFDNIKISLSEYRLHVHLFSSTLYAVFGALFAVIFSSMAAYSLIRLKPKFNFLLFIIIYSGTIFPFQMYKKELFVVKMKIPFGTVSITGKSRQLIQDCLHKGRISNGRLVRKFEEE